MAKEGQFILDCRQEERYLGPLLDDLIGELSIKKGPDVPEV